jgi:hypothetical protein
MTAVAVSDESLVLQLHLEEVRRQQQLEDDVALALALHLSAADTGDNNTDTNAPGGDVVCVYDSSGGGGDGGGGLPVDLARQLLNDGDRSAALSEALQATQAADICARDASFIQLLGRYVQAKQYVNRLDARRGLSD